MRKSIAIIGGGTAALFCAANLDASKFDISIYEQHKSLGKKFLVAGKGGFNLTHAELIVTMIKRYTPSRFLKPALLNFSNTDFGGWLDSIGIPTYIGSSKRIYPIEGIKPIEVLQAIKKRISENDVKIRYNHTWDGWNNEGDIVFNGDKSIKADYVIFSLGGSSWKVTGSDGTWINHFKTKGIATKSFEASNCAYEIDWCAEFIKKHHGAPLKNMAISCGEEKIKGEVVITKYGLEGNAIYGLGPEIRKELSTNGFATIYLDLKPILSSAIIHHKFTISQGNTTKVLKEKLKLSPAQIGLLKHYLPKETFIDHELLSKSIKSLPIKILNTAPIDEAISTIGGVDLNAVDNHYQLNKLPNHFCIGEMLDWDAPTGGYLIQGCVSMAVYLAEWLNEKNS